MEATTKTVDKTTGEFVELPESLADYFIGSLDQAMDYADSIEPEHLLKLLVRARADGVDMSVIKGMFGELEALKTLKNIEEYKAAVLRTVNNRAGGNVQGIDSVWDLSDGRVMYVESKNLSAPASGNRTAGLVTITNQFDKHIREAISPHFGSVVDNVTQTSKYIWKENKSPRLHYELRGGFFDEAAGTNREGMIDIFKNRIKNSSDDAVVTLNKLLESDPLGFDAAFDKFMRIEDYPDLVYPLSS